MAEVLTSFTTPVRDDFGSYYARAVGRPASDHQWEGWIEFVPADGGGGVLVSPIESRQPERQHLAYWATGLTPVYLEGALRRARHPPTVRVPIIDEPISDRPAEPRGASAGTDRTQPPPPAGHHRVLQPRRRYGRDAPVGRAARRLHRRRGRENAVPALPLTVDASTHEHPRALVCVRGCVARAPVSASSSR